MKTRLVCWALSVHEIQARPRFSRLKIVTNSTVLYTAFKKYLLLHVQEPEWLMYECKGARGRHFFVHECIKTHVKSM